MPSTPANQGPLDARGDTLPKASSGVRGVPAETLFKAGDRVAENIELVSLLGVGGMGDVWLANHIGLDTAVAVKFMSAALAHDPALIERFAREAKLASRIKSPHVVQIFDFATTHEGIPYIVMELIEGETLEARIQRDGKLGLEETSRILVQLCRALTKAHENGVIHRDMKPDNVLLGADDGELFVRILDFGIAKHVDGPKGVTDAGATMGTPSYMSPEQLFHPIDVDHRSDLWSLGVMTYLCLTGSLPFRGDSFAAVCVAINEGTYLPASKASSEMPRGMDAWFSRALATAPEKRFNSAKEMSDAYLLILDGIGKLPLWAVRKDTGEGGAPSFAGGTGAVPATLIPGRRVRGDRRRTAAAVVGGAMLVAFGFLSRDAAVGRFVKAHVPTGWLASVDRFRTERVIDTPSLPAPAETPKATAAPPPILVPKTPPPPSRPTSKISQVALQTPRSVPVVSARPADIERPSPDAQAKAAATPGEAVVVPTPSESESNPYSAGEAPSEPLQPLPNPPPASAAHAPPL